MWKQLVRLVSCPTRLSFCWLWRIASIISLCCYPRFTGYKKNVNYWFTHSLTALNEEMLAHVKIVVLSFIGQDFICKWGEFSSYSNFFLHKYPMFWTTHVQYYLNIMCIFTQVQTKKLVFGRKMSKIQPFTFYIFSLSKDTRNCQVQ